MRMAPSSPAPPPSRSSTGGSRSPTTATSPSRSALRSTRTSASPSPPPSADASGPEAHGAERGESVRARGASRAEAELGVGPASGCSRAGGGLHQTPEQFSSLEGDDNPHRIRLAGADALEEGAVVLRERAELDAERIGKARARGSAGRIAPPRHPRD